MRATIPSSPPLASIHSIWSASRNRVASAGVLYVWSLTEFSSAIFSDRNSGIQRPPGGSAAIDRIRCCAAGLSSANQIPPSDANPFCGAK